MKYLLIYYTGTHNTRYLVNQFKKRLEEDGDTADTVEIKSDTPAVNTEGYDLVGLSYPIYGFNAPRPFNAYLRKLSFPKGQKYFIFKNSGEVMAMNNVSSRVPKRILKGKGCVFCGEYHFVMPYNIHFRFPDEFVREAMLHNKKLLEIMLHNLRHGILSRPKNNHFYQVGSICVSIQKIGGPINSFLYRVDPDKCTACGLCVKNCPHHNIEIKDGKVKFHHHCDMCMACSFFCPADAVRIGILESWRINGAYPLERLAAEAEEMAEDAPPFITEKTEGFYRCFFRYFEDIDKKYQELERERTEEIV